MFSDSEDRARSTGEIIDVDVDQNAVGDENNANASGEGCVSLVDKMEKDSKAGRGTEIFSIFRNNLRIYYRIEGDFKILWGKQLHD